MPNPVIISIEGNIGCGKSTFLSKLKELLPDVLSKKDLTVKFVPEPIDVWETITDEEGTPMLELFYGDQERNAFSFQMMAYISRLDIMRRELRGDADVIIVERCLYTDAEVFAKMLFDDNKIRAVDYAIYRKWFDTFADEVKPHNIIYLRADPSVCLTRTQLRARDGEGGIGIEYLTNCHKYHDSWLYGRDCSGVTHGCEILVLDANTHRDSTGSAYEDWISVICKDVLDFASNPKTE